MTAPVRHRRGASAVEMAVIAPILIYLTFAGMDFAWYFAGYQEAKRAVQAAAAAGAHAQPDEGHVAVAFDSIHHSFAGAAFLSDSDARVNAFIVDDPIAGPFIQVEAKVVFSPLVGLVPVLDGFSASHRVLLEVQPPE